MNDQQNTSEIFQKRIFNEVSKTYDQFHSSAVSVEYRRAIYSKISEIHKKNLIILDALCGGGANSILLSENGNKVVAVDISEEQCKLYKLRHPRNEIICASILDVALPKEFFDVIYLDSLHHLHPHVNKAMDKFYELLKPGGVLILWEPNEDSIFNWARILWYKLDRKYFAPNEAAINLKDLAKQNSKFSLVYKVYGGNIAYAFIFLLYPTRVSFKFIEKYFPLNLFIKMECFINQYQPRLLSFWFLAVFKKSK
jgi:SAM-dependent methyltransferase